MAKKSKHYPGKLGSGERFKACVADQRKKGVKNPEGLCAKIGRKKYGKKRFAELGAKGRKK
jgi:hypothetical protein